MNKEVEEAKYELESEVESGEYLGSDLMLGCETGRILLNYIQELEDKLTRYEKELDLDYVDNNFIEKKVVQELIHNERTLAEAQTTYEVNEMWKEKIENMRDKYQNEINKLENQELWDEPVDTILHNRYINYYNILQELLNEEE